MTASRLAAVPSECLVTGFSDFYRREYPATARLAYLLTRQHEVAEDITQEAFAIVFGRYDAVENPGAYLRVTAVNLCHRWHRSNGRQERRLRLVHAGDVQPGEEEYLRDAVAALPFKQRTVLVLRYWAGLSEREIAEALGCRPGTVKSLASRALAQLRTEVTR